MEKVSDSPAVVRAYLSKIGKRGGRRSRRTLSSEDARQMVKVREARRAFKRFRTRCFWSYDPDSRITKSDISWVAEQLMKNGNAEAWRIAEYLCR